MIGLPKQRTTLSGSIMTFAELAKPVFTPAFMKSMRVGAINLKCSQMKTQIQFAKLNSFLLVFTLVFFTLITGRAHSELSYQIAVFTDEIVAPGELGTNLHLNATPQGLTVPTYAGEVMNVHGQRLTPEFSYGLSRTVEVGLLLPMTRTNSGTLTEAGYVAKLKYLPVQPLYGEGYFAGLNLEWGQLKPEFVQSQRFYELRYILGWKNEDWLVSANPIFNWPLSTGYIARSPDYTLALKTSYRLTASSHYGLEYYSGKGKLNNPIPYSQQNNTLYFVWDYDHKPYEINLGLGRGLNSSSDTWTIKSIVAWPF